MHRQGLGADVAIFALLTLIWGTTWAAIRVTLEAIPPMTGVAVRFLFAGALLFALARVRGVPLGRSRVEQRLWWLNGLTTFAGSYGIVYWSEQTVPSGLASVLFATFPLFVGILAHFALPAERLTARRAAALLVGFTGVGVLFSEDFSRLGASDIRGAALVFLLAPLVSAIGSVGLKRWGGGIPPLSMAAVPMLIGGASLGLLAAAFERDLAVRWSAGPWLATLYLALAGSALTFTLYFRLLARRSVVASSLISFTVPVVAVLVGWLAFREPFTWRLAAGTGLILAGVGFALTRSRRTPLEQPAGEPAGAR